MGDYFQHWLDMGKRMSSPPRVFHVNWFRTDENGDFLWPGFGENLRVIEWILDRCRGEADAVKTPIGYVPTPDSLDLNGVDIAPETLSKLLAVNRQDWYEETDGIASFFQQLGHRLSKAIWDQLESLRLRLRAPISLMKPGAEIRPLAAELNEIIERENPYVFSMLSDFGKRVYFPKGILAQSAEAKEKAKRYDATIGIARENGQPMHLSSVMHYFKDLSAADALTYAPATGRPDLREQWRASLAAKSPGLAGKSFSLPVVTSGVTHALSLVGDLFVDKGDMVLLPDKFWENYELLFGVRFQAQLAIYPFFNAGGGFNVEALRQALATRAGSWKTVLILNFPNNPTGYTPTLDEAKALVAMLVDKANSGRQLLVFTDDAYFGLFFEKDTCTESLFALLCAAHENIFAVKGDAATKEEMVWGFRIGFITYGAKGLSEEHYEALGKKTMGAIRGVVSSCTKPGQSILLKGMRAAGYAQEKEAGIEQIGKRYRYMKEVLARYKDNKFLRPLPFNSGYFMAFECAGNAETLRLHLLDTYQVGTISIQGKYLRLAFSSIDIEQIDDLIAVVYKAAEELFQAERSDLP